MAEQNYGMMPDHFSWEVALASDATEITGPFQVFSVPTAVTTGEPNTPRPVARADHLSLYVRAFVDGGGENGLHSHDDDSIWLVLSGRAAFAGEDGLSLGTLDAHHGVLIPAGVSYKFVCSGDTVLARIAARADY
jgi:mannose-6-phosphate isomerase-like protein (cupin superfamily)